MDNREGGQKLLSRTHYSVNSHRRLPGRAWDAPRAVFISRNKSGGVSRMLYARVSKKRRTSDWRMEMKPRTSENIL